MATPIDPTFVCWKKGTPTESNTPSIMSLPHTKHVISGSKVASWTQNSQIWKFEIFKFCVQPIEYSIQRESSYSLTHSSILISETLGHALSNALSTILIRRLQLAVPRFKVAHKNGKSRKSKFQFKMNSQKFSKTLIWRKKFSFP